MASSHPPLSESTTLVLLEGSVQFFPALIAALDAAQSTVQMETYIFDFTRSGTEVALALQRAAQRGVRVQLIVDGFGTPALPEQWMQRFHIAGVALVIFEPIVAFGVFVPRQWRRLHRKLCAIDSQIAFCGGINVLDDFYDPNYGHLPAARFDFCVQVRGVLAHKIHTVSCQLWDRLKSGRMNVQTTSKEIKNALDFFAQQERRPGSDALQELAPQPDLVLRDNLTNRTKIERAYLKAIGESRKEVIIANAYFLPGAKLRKALILAAGRGVKVQLLLQGKYEYFMQYHAARPVYRTLLTAGIEIHEYAASYLHAKVAVIDGVWATVGSSNLDPLSLLLAREANVVVRNKGFASNLRERLLIAMQTQGKQIFLPQLANRPLVQRILDWVAFIFMRMALWVIGKRY